MMSCTPIIEEDDHNNFSQSTLVMDIEPMGSFESPPSDRMIKVLDGWESPTAVPDFMGSARSDCEDEDDSSVSYDLDISEKSEDSHQSLQEMITKSLSQIEGVMGEIMNETSSSSTLHAKLLRRRSGRELLADDDDDIVPAQTSSLQAELSNADQEEKQYYKKSVMANVEKLSNELEATRKNEEELKNRIDKLRGQLAQRRALRNRIVNASRVVEHNVNSLPVYLQNKPKEQQEPSEESKENINRPTTKDEKRSWLSMFRARRRQQRQQEAETRDQEQSTACRNADELLVSFRSSAEDKRTNFEEQQTQVEAGRRQRFEKQESWGSFVPKSRMQRY